ncbi:MAG: RNA polymerase sigma factor [Propionibacteriaceae bacterium]
MGDLDPIGSGGHDDPGDLTARLEALRAAAVGGDRVAMENLLTLLSPVVRRRCSKFLPCQADAEEAAQETMIILATKLSTFAGRGSFLGWVNAIASNSARATYTALKRRWSERAEAEPPEVPDPRTTSVIAGSRLDLLEALDALQQRHPELVAPVVLRDLADLPYAEIAAQTGVPLGTVKARIHEARHFLRRWLQECL